MMNEQKPGAALMAALRDECEVQGKPIAHLGALLGLAPTYWSAICSGSRTILPLVEKTSACQVFADFLRVPRITVMALAEVVLPEDFVVDQTLDDQLNGVYLAMARDPLWASLVPRPATWDAADKAMKLLIVSLYQAALQASMLEKAGKAAGSHRPLVPREGLAPAPDQMSKWGMPLREATAN